MEKQGTKAHLSHELNLIRQLKARHYDLVVNLADQWRSAILARLTGARIRLGFDFPKRQGFYGATATRIWYRSAIMPACIPLNKTCLCYSRLACQASVSRLP